MAPKIVNLNFLQNVSFKVITKIESIFNSIGRCVAKNPWRTIIICLSFVLLSSISLIRFHQEKNPIKLWTPPNSNFAHDTDWLLKTFRQGYRPQILLIKAKDILQPNILQELNKINTKISESLGRNGESWEDVCFKVPMIDSGLASLLGINQKTFDNSDFDPSVQFDSKFYCTTMKTFFEEGCLQNSILELWKYDDKKLNELTKNDIIQKINTTTISPVTGHPVSYERLLGGIKRDESGVIIEAETVISLWMVDINFTAVDMDKVGNLMGTADWATEHTLNWEMKFIEIMKEFEEDSRDFEVFYTAGRSFADISGATMFGDIPMLMIGIFLMVIYVQLVLSKYNCIEARFSLGFLGLLSIGMAFIVAVSLCSLFGIFYGPVHTSFPFLLMGLGVDDMFVIMACWDQISETVDSKKPLSDRVGLMLQHAGVSITVTSLTDFVVFLVGSSTVLPTLKSYCIYAAIGILFTYIFVITFFIACFTLDQRRLEQNRNSIFPWHIHEDYKKQQCSQRQYSKELINFIYSKIILTKFGKVVIVLITLIFCGFGLEGILKLQDKFDPMWFIPKNTYLHKYIDQRNVYYPHMGFEAGIYMGSLNYTEEFNKIRYLVSEFENSTDILEVTNSWVEPFRFYMKKNFEKDLDEIILSDDEWNMYLSKFLFSPRGAKYQANFQFETKLECGEPADKILASTIGYQFHKFYTPEEYLPAMHKTYEMVENINFTTGDRFVTSWGKVFGNWATDDIIDEELSRNLLLALVCVMFCAIILIANFQMCFWIFVCVLLTMISVGGFMQMWDLTVDIVSCIALTLAIGLCVDYAAHIGYAFLSTNEPTRDERILKSVTNIGSAVVNGGISTLLALSMMSVSEAYSFQAFFKIFLLVTLFGQFYGVIFLPVVLSVIGPDPFQLHKVINQEDDA